MKQVSPRTVQNGTKYIQKEYAFLLERGYQIVSVEDAFLGWQVTLRKADLFVMVEYSRGEDYVYFRVATEPPEEWTRIGIVVNVATGETIPNSGDDGPELRKYIDRIESYFAGEYARDPDALRAAREAEAEANRQLLEKQNQVVAAELAVRKEPKRIPILYYPLLAVILLLIFGALTTLFMVLLNSLFSSFALDADASSLFASIGAVLLAIGTMLLFRKWVKFVG